MEHEAIEALRERHPAWRLLRAATGTGRERTLEQPDDEIAAEDGAARVLKLTDHGPAVSRADRLGRPGHGGCYPRRDATPAW